MGRPKVSLSPADESKIKTFLNLSPQQDFPRCRGKDRTKVKQFEKAGDKSHSARDHVCDECRCEKPAGSGTSGTDCYNLGINVGHWGTGYCAQCRKSVRNATAERAWKEQMAQMQETGLTVTTEQFENKAVGEARKADDNEQLRLSLEIVMNGLNDFRQRLTPEYNERRLEALNNIYDRLNELRPDSDLKDYHEILKETKNVCLGVIDAKGLTEKGRNGPQPVSDLSVHKANQDYAKLLLEFAKVNSDLSKHLHIPVDILFQWQLRVLNLLQRCCLTKQDYDKAAKEFRSIMANTRNTSLMTADVLAGEETMEKSANDH